MATGGVAAPAALAASSPHLYWSDFIAGTVGQADLQGTNAKSAFLTPAHHPFRIAVDGQYLYWTGSNSSSAIGRSNLDGTNANPNFITGATQPQGIAVGAQHIYWSDAATKTIGRANLDGTQANHSFIVGAGGDSSALAVDGQYLYWSNLTAGTIGRANLDGTDATSSFITGASFPSGVAVDGHYVYWSNQGKGTIGRANLDGSDVNESFIAGISGPESLAVDGEHLYWTSVSGNVGEANVDGSNVNQKVVTGGSVDMLGIAVSVPVAQITPAAPPTFAPATVGKPSVSQFLTLTNTGQQTLSWSALTLIGADPGDFVAAPNSCPSSLAPGANCQLMVNFIPQATGERTATLQVTTSDVADGPLEIPLSGTGTPVPPTVPGNVAAPTGGSSTRAAHPFLLLTCRAVTLRHPRRLRHACTARTVPTATRLTAHRRATAAVRIVRGTAVYATGTGVLASRGPWRLLVTDLRPVRAGTYTLILSRSSHKRRRTSRQSITVR